MQGLKQGKAEMQHDPRMGEEAQIVVPATQVQQAGRQHAADLHSRYSKQMKQ